jgi:hypothetical protein
VFDLANFIVALGIIGGIFVWVYKTYRKTKTWYDDHICKRMDSTDLLIAWLTGEAKNGSEERLILMQAQKASMEAIHENKNNGNISKAINDIDNYLLVKSHLPKTELRKEMDEETDNTEVIKKKRFIKKGEEHGKTTD